MSADPEERLLAPHEGDLILGLDSSAIGTLVERTTRFTLLLHLPPMDGHGEELRIKNGPALAGHGADAVRDAVAETISTLPEQLCRSLTWDQGAEMAQHAQLLIETGLDIYFCEPHSPWQRGTNENTNGLLRQYFPKGTDLTRHSRQDLDARRSRAQHATPERLSAGRLPPRPSTTSYDRPNKAALRRPLEPGQYLSIRYTERLAEAGAVTSVGSVGDSYDNALAETIIGLYKTELIDRRGPGKGIDDVEYATLEWVDWFNHRRLLEPIGHVPRPSSRPPTIEGRTPAAPPHSRVGASRNPGMLV